MHAILTAGGIPREHEPLYSLTRGSSKALLGVGDKPMLQWMLDAVGESKRIERVLVVGIDGPGSFTCTKELEFMPNQGGFLSNIRNAGLELIKKDPQAEFLISISADIPAIRGHMIDEIIEEAESGGEDFYYCVIEKKEMQARFPESIRTYLRFRDAVVCGGDLAVIRTSIFSGETGVWERLMEARKSKWKTAAAIGFDVLFLFLLRRLTINEAVCVASRRLGVRGCAIHCRHPEVGMDIDKPQDLAVMDRFLRERSADRGLPA
jgi:GTP:adenosylcobinamide-phosphate guanylyltransferase